MDWQVEVGKRIKRRNQIFFSQDCVLLQPIKSLILRQDHPTLVLWALGLATETVTLLEERHPRETRPRQAVDAALRWAKGEVKMPFAQRKILDCHALAKEWDNPEEIALCHSVGQACGVVHTVGHALGYPIYEMTAIVCRLGLEASKDAVEQRVKEYENRLLQCANRGGTEKEKWAGFMKK